MHGLDVIKIAAVVRLDRQDSLARRDLKSGTARNRHLPDPRLPFLQYGEVDPVPVSGKAGKSTVGQLRCQMSRLAAARGHDKNWGTSFGVAVKGNESAVRRPARETGRTATDVTWTALDPSGSATQISDSPDRLDTNATRRPSGERLGRVSVLVETMAPAAGEEAGRPAVANSIRHTFASEKLRTYTRRRCPSAVRATTGARPSWPINGRRVGVAPLSASNLQSHPRAANKISRLSGIHAGLPALTVDVTRMGSPSGIAWDLKGSL